MPSVSAHSDVPEPISPRPAPQGPGLPAAPTTPSLALAQAHLRTAEEILARLGHTVVQRGCRSLIAALTNPEPAGGIRPVRLTPREREIGGFVALGLTNREVAESLHLSEKTIEYHLRNLYAKLGIANRRELRSLSANPAGHPSVQAAHSDEL